MSDTNLYNNLQIKTAQARAVKLTESTLQLSNIDLVASYFFKGENSGSMPATLSIQNEIISPALSGVQVSIFST